MFPVHEDITISTDYKIKEQLLEMMNKCQDNII